MTETVRPSSKKPRFLKDVLKDVFNMLTPNRKRKRPDYETQDPTSPSGSVVSSIDAIAHNINLNWGFEDTDGELDGRLGAISKLLPKRYPDPCADADSEEELGGPAKDPIVRGIRYPHRLRLWCCHCCHLASYTDTFDISARYDYGRSKKVNVGFLECRFCSQYMPERHLYCEECALVQIVEKQLARGAKSVFSAEALKVVSHPEFKAGAIGYHGPLFYVVECCKNSCDGVYRCDLVHGERVQDSEEPYEDGLFIDFTKWLCPDCTQPGCERCRKMVVATQVLAGEGALNPQDELEPQRPRSKKPRRTN